MVHTNHIRKANHKLLYIIFLIPFFYHQDEDKNLSSEELSRKLEKLIRQSEQQLIALAAGSHALRATCYGQDRLELGGLGYSLMVFIYITK